MNRKELELKQILDDHDKLLKEMVTNELTNFYFKAMQEVDKRKLSNTIYPERIRIDYFLRSLFYFIFKKMHKDNRLRALEILEELKIKVNNM